MALGIILTAVAILSVIAFVRELKRRNIIGIAFSALSVLIFGFVGIMTLFVSGAPIA